ncbi:MAG: UbiA family prenyltransferase [Calditrichae bacterium]|nr:UbiA family prenyltransferase [Calditrichia bacterium]
MNRSRLLGIFRLFRFELPFTAGICVILGQLLAIDQFPPISIMALGFLSIFCISATALILNDYFDLEIDRVNSPERPLPSGIVTKQDVVLLSIGVAMLGLIASYLISFTALLISLFVWMIGFLYNWRFKRSGLWGNLMVSFSVGMTFIFGGISVSVPFAKMVWFFAVIVALINVGEEIAADAMDVQGDRQAGSQSLAVVLGPERALRISAAVFMAVVGISSLPFWRDWLDWIYLLPISIMDGVILYSTAKLLNPQTADRRRYVRWIYLGGLAAILIFILIRFALASNL